jgi:integrase
MHPELKPILLNWKQEWEEIFKARSKRHPDEPSPPHDWVFFNPRNQDERANSFFKCFYQAREKAGLPEMTRHTLRHYFISQCVMSGIEFFTIAKWVGHTNTKMIEEVYGHLDPSFRRSQMAKLRVVPEEKVEGAA